MRTIVLADPTVNDHSFLAIMLGFVIVETLCGTLLVGYFVYRVRRRTSSIAATCEHIDAVLAATYLTVVRALRRLR